MIPATEPAYAKINLALHVRRRDADGYHAIETLFAFAEDGDVLRLTERPGLAITGPFADSLTIGDDNLVLRAAHGFAEITGRGGDLGFALDKRLPVAAGIGGGSADAAAALRLLCSSYGIDHSDRRIAVLAAALGADVPACLGSRPVRGEGRGDLLTPAEGMPTGQPLLLVNPNLPLSTKMVFAAWDGIDRGPLGSDDPVVTASAGRNDLEAPAASILPVIGELLALLKSQRDVTLARMSGSGATCFALFGSDTARDDAVKAIKIAHPDWWQLATKLR